MTKNNRAEDVYAGVCELLVQGQVLPGTQLVERDLAAKLGVSRVPVRDALNKMVAQGLLTGGGHRAGVRVRNYSPGEIQQMVEYRQMLECGTVRLAVLRATDRDLARLRSICDKGETLIGSYGSKRWAENDHQFHLAIAEAAGNERLFCAIDLLLTESHFLFYLAPSRYRSVQPNAEEVLQLMQRVVAEHRQLVTFIQQGEADQADRLIRQHVKTTQWVMTEDSGQTSV